MFSSSSHFQNHNRLLAKSDKPSKMATHEIAKDDVQAQYLETLECNYVKAPVVGLNDRLPLPEALAHLTPDEEAALEKRIVRKIDMRLMPIIICMFWLNVLDRNSISNAKIAGMPKDLGMNDSQYNTCLMIFYVGYVLTQLPSNAILPLVRPSLYFPAVTLCWGVVSMSQGFLHSYSSIMAVRFFIGIIEGPFFPGVIFLLSC